MQTYFEYIFENKLASYAFTQYSSPFNPVQGGVYS